MKTYATIITVLLIGCLAIIWIQYQSANLMSDFRTAEQLVFQDALEKSRQRLQSYADSAHKLTVRLALTRDSMKVAVNARKREIAELKKFIADRRPEIAERIDTIPDLREFVAVQDSIIERQDNLIRGMELSHSAEIVDLEEIIRLQEAKFKEQMAITAGFEQRLVVSEAETKKERKGKKFRNVVIGVLSGLILIQAVR